MRKRIAGAITILFVAVVTCGAFAQSPPSELQEATVAFDLRIGKLRNGELMKLLGVEKELSNLKESGQIPGEIDIAKVDRIFGALSLPDNVETFQEFGNPEPPEELPFDMFLRIELADKETADEMFDEIIKKATPVEIDGRKFYAPTEEGSPTNVVMHRADDTTIEMGTKSYLSQDKRKELFSEGLGAAWAKVPDHAIRVAIDMKSESALIAEAVEMGKTTAPDPTVQAYLDLVDNAMDLRISIDLDSPNLIVVAATGVDADQAEELRSGLDSLLGMAKFGGQQALGMIPDPNAAKLAGEILESLKATADGTNVLITIPKPDGFNDVIKQAVDQLKEMQEMMQEEPESGQSDGSPGADG